MLEDPLQGIRKLVKQKGGAPKTNGKVKIHIILRLPVNSHQEPVIRMNCDKPKGGLKVIVHLNVLKGVGVLGNVVTKILAPSGAPFRIMFFFLGTRPKG